MATKRYPSLVPAKVVNDAIDGEWCTLTKNAEEDRSIGTIRIPKMSQMNACNEVEDLSEALAKQNLHQLPTSKILDMTPQERLQALEDIHGVMDLPEEDSDVIQTRLLEMDEVLAKLDLRQRIAFDEAVKRNSAYVKRFRLAFLRADAYDATKAAQRMAAHFECRLNLFENSDVLGRDIKLSDLSAWNKDLPLIERGAIQLLKHPDSAGRSIILICSGKYPYAPYHFPSLGRFILMLSNMAARSHGKEGQRRGLIVLWVGHGATQAVEKTDSLSNARRFFSLFPVFPIRVRGIHCCHDDERLTQLWNRVVAVIEPQQAVRFQSHYGSLSACLQSLRRFGIPQEILPLDAQGNLDVSDFRESLLRYGAQLDDGRNDRKGMEFPVRTVAIRFPIDNDILLGKGKRSDKFRGNHLFRKAIAENYDAYNASSDRRGKVATLQLIYFRLLQSGCRFLAPLPREDGREDRDEWMVIPEEDALAKISMGIRNFRRKGSSSGRNDSKEGMRGEGK